MNDTLFERLEQASAFVRDRIGPRRPSVGLILGSGLGPFADQLEDAARIDYADIPHFPVSRVEGHAGRLVVGQLQGVQCVAMQGRVHFYEGHDLRTATFPARVLVSLGATTLIVTNAAGGIGERVRSPGTLMLIRDHLNLFPDHPLRGANDDRLGRRFPDMSEAYDASLRELALTAAAQLDIELIEGVYAGLSGPTYETPAEVRMLAAMGADATGMSTVPEVIVARHMGARVLGISCITNAAAGLGAGHLSHDEVTETARQVQDTFCALLARILGGIGEAA